MELFKIFSALLLGIIVVESIEISTLKDLENEGKQYWSILEKIVLGHRRRQADPWSFD